MVASQLVAFHTLAMLRPQHLHVVDVANAEQLGIAAIRFALAVIATVIASCPCVVVIFVWASAKAASLASPVTAAVTAAVAPPVSTAFYFAIAFSTAFTASAITSTAFAATAFAAAAFATSSIVGVPSRACDRYIAFRFPLSSFRGNVGCGISSSAPL